MIAAVVRMNKAGRASALVVAVVVSGCSYQSFVPEAQHYSGFDTRAPYKNSIIACSGYGCRHQTKFRFTPADIATMREHMTTPRHASTAEGERRAIAMTLAWMEKRVGDAIGTSADRPGDDFAGNGDPNQMDCVDVATNLMSYLIVLESNRLIKQHTVGPIIIKEDMKRGYDGWTHYAATLAETNSTRSFAVDGWKLPSGVEPEIVHTDKWYIEKPDLNLMRADKRRANT